MIVEARRDVVTLRGSLVNDQWPTIQAAAKLLLEEHPRGIIIDCSQLVEVTEAGAKTFLDGINYIQKHNARIIVAGLPENALEVIRSVRAVMSQLPIAPTVEDARASLGLEYPTQPTRDGERTIIALLAGEWQQSVNIACRIADRKKDEVHLLEVLSVPRTMPLATPMPEAEAAAKQKLDDAEKSARQCKATVVRHVERGRMLSEGVHRVISSLNPAIIIGSSRKTTEGISDTVNSLMNDLLSSPPTEVIYSRRPAESKLSQEAQQTIAVMLAGEWRRAVEVACHLSDKKRQDIHLISLLKVPRAMAIDAPMPEEEARSRRRLEESANIAKQYKIKTIGHIERVRIVQEGLQKALSAIHPDVLVVCISRVDNEISDLVNQIMPSMIENPPCEIIYIRQPEPIE